MQVLVEDVAVGEAEGEEVAAWGDGGVDPVQEFQQVGTELLDGGHTLEGFLADVVADQLHEHYQWVVLSGATLHSLDIIRRVS